MDMEEEKRRWYRENELNNEAPFRQIIWENEVAA